jgi:N-acetylneuraminate synthase/N,N'-diacetyllegionaminate synthase
MFFESHEEPYIIAEVGINHNGCLDTAKKMIDVAKAANVDAVKFQTFKAEEFCGDPKELFTYHSQGQEVTESMLEMFRRYEFESDQWREIAKYCNKVGITFLSTPQNESDLDLLLEIGISAIKIGSDDFTNIPLIKAYSRAKLPVIMSCGMSNLAEVHMALDAAGWFSGSKVVLLLCTSKYPTAPKEVNVSKITTLQNAFPGLIVGFSDHTQDNVSACMAVALGARVFEKHFTLSHDLPGPDHWFSEEPAGISDWANDIRKAFECKGDPIVVPNQSELDMKVLARRSIFTLKDIKAGEVFDEKNIGLRRPGSGMPPARFVEILGLRANTNLKRGVALTLGDVT